jgi:hypothetical protein
MVAKYSLRQRGRAYAHMAQLLGAVKGASVPGLATVFTITKDYAGQVLYGRKNDVLNIPARLPGTRDEVFGPPAEIGMRLIRNKGVELRPPSREQLHDTYERVRALYSDAYGWEAGDIEEVREYAASTGMRQYVRSWINVWDLRRLYDYQAADLVAESPTISYEEDADMQIETTDDEPIITT